MTPEAREELEKLDRAIERVDAWKGPRTFREKEASVRGVDDAGEKPVTIAAVGRPEPVRGGEKVELTPEARKELAKLRRAFERADAWKGPRTNHQEEDKK